MVTDGEATGCRSGMAASTAQDGVAGIAGLFCSGDSLQSPQYLRIIYASAYCLIEDSYGSFALSRAYCPEVHRSWQ